jgi:S-DNA-T family DNA segregation ATPase FtsK/SpoIIIE
MNKRVKSAEEVSEQFPSFLKSFILFSTSILLSLSLVTFSQENTGKNALGLLGYSIAFSLHYAFGYSCFFIPLFLMWIGVSLKKRTASELRLKTGYFVLGLFSSCILLSIFSYSFPTQAAFFEKWSYSDFYLNDQARSSYSLRHYLGGVPFFHLYVDMGQFSFIQLLGKFGSFLIFSLLFVLSFILMIDFHSFGLFAKAKELFLDAIYRAKRQNAESAKALPQVQEREITLSRSHPLVVPKVLPPMKQPQEMIPKAPENKEEKLLPPPPSKVIAGYTLPSPALLTQVKKIDSSALKNDLRHHADILEETLLNFGLEAKVGDIHCGPTITLFEVHPPIGVKVQKIKALENDIALNMQAKSIRIIAPIPGKAAVGIEVPSPYPQEVGFRDLIETYHRQSKKAFIPLLLGKAVNGEDIWTDLTKMPHCIIAGATGSGKSVCINTIVMSILMNAHPDEIKLVMVDPKKVELTAYSCLPHMLAPVITEPEEAYTALKWLVKEMERRYEIFRLLNARNIHAFNTRTINKELESSLEKEIPERLPYIVVIVDELADLMMVSSSDIETPIARIAQMARAVGIHLILATQRPSREVITGLIKANFPSRIAFKVASRVNSQIVIDENGAETLLGNGDMLFLPPGTSTLIRVQGAFIRDEDINRVIEFIGKQAVANYLIPSFTELKDQLDSTEDSEESDSNDSLYGDAKKIVLEMGTASTSFLQRKLKIGYARAASLMDELETKGIIGPQDGAKRRKIFYPGSSRDKNDDDDLG